MSDAIQQARLQNKMKSPGVALLLGFIFPGVGQMYAGSIMWGVINLIVFTVCIISIIASPISFIVWLLSIFLGYKSAKAFNEKVIDNAETAGERSA